MSMCIVNVNCLLATSNMRWGICVGLLWFAWMCPLNLILTTDTYYFLLCLDKHVCTAACGASCCLPDRPTSTMHSWHTALHENAPASLQKQRFVDQKLIKSCKSVCFSIVSFLFDSVMTNENFFPLFKAHRCQCPVLMLVLAPQPLPSQLLNHS